MELDLAPGESRGYWKYHTPGKWFKQAKAVGKINNEKATLLFDSGAEVSIIDTTFARKVGCIYQVPSASTWRTHVRPVHRSCITAYSDEEPTSVPTDGKMAFLLFRV